MAVLGSTPLWRRWNRNCELTHSDEGNFLVLLVARDTLRTRIEGRFAIDQELIVMVALWQGHLCAPATVRLTFHRRGRRMPIIKIANQGNLLGGVHHAQEVNGLDGFLCRILRLRTKMRIG